MAIFTNLYHASEALKHVLDQHVTPAPANGILAAPPPDAIPTTEEIRVSLMWVNEQPTHRNDTPVRNPDGTTTPPPVSLSVFFMVTAYGEGPSKNADAAHRLLGEVLRVFHAEPRITFPLPGLPNNSGEGYLDVALVPITPELMEKLFSPLQTKHRPFLLYEVGPVQLKSTKPTGPAMPVVAPGGIVLSGPTPTSRPSITHLVPSTQAEGGFLRIDGVFSAAIDAVWIGSTKIVAPNFTVIDPSGALRVQLPTGGPDAIPPGVHRVTVTAGPLQSDPVDLRVIPAGSWALDGPSAVTHSQAAPLTLTGQNLGSTDLVYVWPDAGVRAPSDVTTFVPSTVQATSVTVPITGLHPGRYRLAARVSTSPALFTPYVVLELAP